MNTLFPIFIKAENLNILLVGGGYVGLEKLTAVLTNAPNATVTLVAPQISPAIEVLAARHPTVSLRYEPYQTQHLNGHDLVIVGTGIRAVSEHVQADCRQRHLLVNVADTPDLCDFYLGSVVQKGDLKIAISTNGKSPTLAKRLRELLADILPDSLQESLDNLTAIRQQLQGDFAEKVAKLNEITRVLREK